MGWRSSSGQGCRQGPDPTKQGDGYAHTTTSTYHWLLSGLKLPRQSKRLGTDTQGTLELVPLSNYVPIKTTTTPLKEFDGLQARILETFDRSGGGGQTSGSGVTHIHALRPDLWEPLPGRIE